MSSKNISSYTTILNRVIVSVITFPIDSQNIILCSVFLSFKDFQPQSLYLWLCNCFIWANFQSELNCDMDFFLGHRISDEINGALCPVSVLCVHVKDSDGWS